MGDICMFLQDNKGNIYVSQADLVKWRFTIPDIKPLTHKGQPYYSLRDFNNLTYKINQLRMSIHITTSLTNFRTQDLDAWHQSFVIPKESSLGGYFNYDTIAQKGKHSNQLSGLFTAGLFNEYGTGFTDFLAQRNDYGRNKDHKIVRLNFNWQIDNPFTMTSLVMGDSYTSPGMWGNSVGFGGIQWGTNFQTQPAFITFPLPSAKGEAVIPSVVDLYLKDNLVGKQDTAAGPFSINSIPVTTGAGVVNMVVNDLIGRQQIISVPYYASPALLKPGLHKYTYSSGFIRRSFGIKSNDYSAFAITGNHQLGFTENFTGEAHTEFLQKLQTAGLGGNFNVFDYGIFNLAVAGSHHSHRKGGLVSTGFQRQTTTGISFGGNIQAITKSFYRLGTPPKCSPRYLITSFVGMSLYDAGSLGTTFTRQENWKSSTLSFLNINYNQTLKQGWTLNISAVTNIGGRNNQSAFLTLSYAIGDNTTVNVGGTIQKKENQQTLQVIRSLPIGPGYGYNLYAGNGQQRNYQASLTGQIDEGTYTAGVANHAGDTAGQLQASGALAFLNQNIYLTRTTGQSFAVVDVPGYGDVGVYYQNQLVGRTDKDGTLLVPRLLPYQNNPLRIEMKDLPLDAQIEKDEMNAIPYYRSGLVINFPIKSSAGALMKLLLPSGEPVPLDAIVTYKEDQVPVGYEGEVYITGLEENNILNILYKNEHYICNIKYTKTNDLMPNLGAIQCQKP